jgi:outer membrane protein OmpA-like peptidoglycan-associated protein
MKASMTTKPTMMFGAAVLALLSTGCATKKHVRQVVGPVEARVGSVEKRTADQAAALGDVENNVSRVDEKAMEADRKAGAAGQAAQAAQSRADSAYTSAGQANTAAGQAQQMADQTRSRLSNVVGNLDNYQHVTTESVFFAVNKSKLTKDEMQKLDDAVAKLQGNSNYVLEVQGFTDKTGSAAANLELGRRRAEEVVRYLTVKHQVPLRRIHVLGIGVAPDSDNKTRAARQQNRRVDINVFARALEPGAAGAVSNTQGAAAQGTTTDGVTRGRTTPTGTTTTPAGTQTPPKP